MQDATTGDRKDKRVVFYYKEETAEVKADFFIGNTRMESKSITNTEYDALEDWITPLPKTYDAQSLYEDVSANACFDTDGEETNFELILWDLVKA